MKKILFFVIVLASAFFYSSCGNDIDLTAEWKDIPIVYGLISPKDSVNYIRLEKAFLDNNTSALQIAQNPDSLYYDNITVQIKSLNPDNEVTYDLVRVDGNLEGFPRDEGIFASAPNYLYKLENPNGELLEQGEDYELQINRGDNLPLVTASATMVSRIQIRQPEISQANVGDVNWSFSGLNIDWRASPDAFIFDVLISMHIEEKDISNPANDRIITLDWKIKENLEAVVINNQVRLDTRISAQELYQYLSNRLEANTNVSRDFLSFDILVSGGGEALFRYISAGNANTGITSTQVIPTYTNLSEGFGIFSSKNFDFHEGYTLNSETVDSLQNNPLTRDLNFQD